MGKECVFATVFVSMLLLWLFLTGFTREEFVAGCFVSFIVSAMSYRFFSLKRKNYIKSFAYFIIYIPFYIYQEILSHAEVLYSILTGRINPGIVKVYNFHESDIGTTTLANSITMTPGTLTLKVEKNKLFVHCLNLKADRKKIGERFECILSKVFE